ncbi:hypothetical protein [Corallococcus llansteffanensis]|uniref:Uncharacterized protein n=1 Tax=Corallococcus llansteffanensis TaxID=2316731 RepID=A0A3A8P1Z9_9BACT|nr:hypothetical protein [Corallococcus llansteffanensis]RKH49460.1 hypothetical protein D7V93_31870 [Corallococcus llansteffanensis]
MGRLILFVLGVAVLAGVAYYATQPGAGSTKMAGQDAARRLDNVRQKAKEIEAEQRQHLDETMQKASGEDSR